MPENILVAVAWPYANAEIHVGNITGAYLPADIITRYHRLKGNNVIMVSGTDSHGTPVTIRADQENQDPETVYKRFHTSFIDLFIKTGLTYDLFTTTHTRNHYRVSQSIFLALLENGYLYTETRPQWYSPEAERFLPDRYIEGTCYICGYEGARSDQCDNCGNVLEADKLLEPRSKVDDSSPVLKETEHYFFDLSKIEPQVVEFLRARKDYWRDTVIGQSLGQIENDGLLPRPITRDLDWGIPVPVEGWEGKCLYVWFEAVIGYLSAPIEWSALNGEPDAWKAWWTDPKAKGFYFIGKDNIFFHASLWPAQIMGVKDKFPPIFNEDEPAPLTAPYDVPANQFMNMEGSKISGSRNWAVWGHDFLERHDPDALRFYLIANMPENRDSDWDWDDFVARNNNQLVANWGNLANRVLSFGHKHWQGVVPDPGELRPEDQAIIDTVNGGFDSVGKLLDGVKIRAAMNEILRLATEVNKYLDASAPWKAVKTDKDEAGKSIYTALRCIDSLSTLMAPFLPFSSEKLRGYLGYETPIFGTQWVDTIEDDLGEHTALRYNPEGATGTWAPSELTPGTSFQKPKPLFRKLDVSVADEERNRLG